MQIKLLAEACFLAASADEPVERNFVRKHALAFQAANNCDLETASLRVFGNADGAYGANVNHLVDNGRWNDEDELAETYMRRKGFAYGVEGQPVQQTALLKNALATSMSPTRTSTSVELGVTTVDHYFDTLGGISRAVRMRHGGQSAPVYIGDQTRGDGTVRTLSEQVSLETRTRMLNPKWYEAHAQARLRGRPPDRGARHQHDGLVGDHGRGGALGLPAAHRDVRARSGDARAARRRSIR